MPLLFHPNPARNVLSLSPSPSPLFPHPRFKFDQNKNIKSYLINIYTLYTVCHVIYCTVLCVSLNYQSPSHTYIHHNLPFTLSISHYILLHNPPPFNPAWWYQSPHFSLRNIIDSTPL